MAPDDPATPPAGRLTRRRLLGAAAAATATGATGAVLSRLHAGVAAGAPLAAAAAAPRGSLATYHCVGVAASLAPADGSWADRTLLPPPPAPADGRVRSFALDVARTDIEVAAGRVLHAWAFNGSVPGPTLRVTEGDQVEVTFRNHTPMPHTVHFHGIHPAAVDGIDPVVPANGQFVYRFTARPYGLFVYHCHMAPVADHINHGMYGVLIIDPPQPRPPAHELVFVMNGYSFAPDGQASRDNDVYSVNGPAGYYACHPIPLQAGQPVRAYVANMTEFDPINSFHLHGNVFKQIPSVRAVDSATWDDTVMLCQGQRSILEFVYEQPGRYMFHAHQSDISEKGWAGFFDVR